MAPSPLANIAATLEVAEDPMLACNGHGEIIWVNQAARLYFQIGPLSAGSPTPGVSALLGPEAARLALSTTHAATYDAHINNQGQHRSLVALQIGTGDPDHLAYLLAFPLLSDASDKVREREEFLAGIAHDLKNPLSAIFGYADVCLDTDLGSSLSTKQREILEKIRRTAVRSMDLIRNYQLLVQIQCGARIKAKEPVDLNTVVHAVINSVWREHSSAPRLTVDLFRTPLLLAVDRVLVDRVVANLFGNAMLYTPPEGAIIVSTTREERTVIVSVHNTGSYIPPDERGQIFEKYQRSSNSTGIPGTGLGLFLVKKILNETKGSITVESDPQTGTRFTVRWEGV